MHTLSRPRDESIASSKRLKAVIEIFDIFLHRVYLLIGMHVYLER
jgi:hypothetical protein